MMGTVELSETEMLKMWYRPPGLTREPFMYHWTWSGGGYDITCTVRIVPPPSSTTTTDCLIGTGTTSEEDHRVELMIFIHSEVQRYNIPIASLKHSYSSCNCLLCTDTPLHKM